MGNQTCGVVSKRWHFNTFEQPSRLQLITVGSVTDESKPSSLSSNDRRVGMPPARRLFVIFQISSPTTESQKSEEHHRLHIRVMLGGVAIECPVEYENLECEKLFLKAYLQTFAPTKISRNTVYYNLL